MRKLYLYLFLAFLFLLNTEYIVLAQKGKLPAKTINAANIIVNEYTALAVNAAVGSTSITVSSSTLNTNGRFPANLGSGDLVMIIQMQGASVNSTQDGGNTFAAPHDSTWGEITTYNNAGKYEFREVQSINASGANTIQFTCGLENAYYISGHTQVIRIPRYTSLIINTACSIVPEAWLGSTGGIVAIEVLGTTTINGSIDASGKGFRGGVKNTVNGCNASCGDMTTFIYGTSINDQGEKGEGIAGNQAEYQTFYGRYARGAVANGGGGAELWNCGGGGGSNAGTIANWRGTGNPDITTSGTYANAWNLEWNGFASTTSSGGGRGGYSSSTAKKDPYTVRPGNSAWASTAGQTGAMRLNGGGLGGRPLDYSKGIFMGGGGGSGHQDNNFGGNGGNGGGIIYLMTYSTVSGTGQLIANGNVGSDAAGTAPSTGIAGQDGAGGGGGGGTIILNSSGGVSGVSVSANGGKGGNQNLTWGTFATSSSVKEAEGPGGGGGGGFVAVSAGSPATTVNGGANGTTNSPYFTTAFPPNGATRGGEGTQTTVSTLPDYNYFLTPQNVTVCSGSNATLTANYTGTLPASAVIEWYSTETGGSPIQTGTAYTATNVTSQQIVYMGICPGFYRVADTIKISAPPTVDAGADVSTCPNIAVGIGSASIGGYSYTWSPTSGLTQSDISNPTATVSSTTTFIVTATNGTGCSKNDTIIVTLNSLPTLNITTSDSTLCPDANTTLTASGASTYTWSTSGNSNIGTSSALNVNATTQTYTVTGSGANGCSAIKTINITRLPEPTISVSPGAPTICPGDSIQLTASGSIAYLWSPAVGLSSSSGASVYAKPPVTNTYTVTGNNGTCSNDTTVTITVATTSTLTFDPSSPSICSGSSVLVGATGGTNYSWFAPSTTLVGTGANVSLSPTTTTTYSVSYLSGGCPLSDTIQVTVNGSLSVSISATSTDICQGSFTSLTVNNASSAAWTGPALSSTTGLSVMAQPTTTSTYTVTGSNGSCNGTDTITINVSTLSVTLNTINTPVICPGDSTPLTASGATNYSWYPASGLSSANSGSIYAQPASTTVYTLTASTTVCSMDTFVTVNVASPVYSTFNPSLPTICPGESASITASASGTNYSWLTAPSTLIATGSSVSLSPSVTTLYTVNYQNSGCPLSDTISVIVGSPVDIVVTTSADSLCSGTSATLNVSNASSATWNTDASLTTTAGLTVTASPTTTTSYIVSGNSGGCADTDTITIYVENLPLTLNTNSTTPICPGDSIQLIAGGAINYSWYPATGLSSTNTGSLYAHPAVTTIYTLTASNSFCSRDTFVTVNVTSPGAITFSPSSPSVCPGNSTAITASGGTNYSWYTPSSVLTATGASVSLSPSGTTLYTVAYESNGCPLADTIRVTVASSLNVYITSSSDSICAGSSIMLTANNAATATWNANASLNSTDSISVTATPSVTTDYVVTGSAGSCSGTDTITIVVTTLPLTLNTNTTTICPGDSIQLIAGGATSYLWTPSTGLSDSTIATPYAQPSVTTIYTVTASNAYCSKDTFVTVNITVPASATFNPATPAICPGQAATITATGGTNYTWFDSASNPVGNSSVLTVSPATTELYSVLYQNSGCNMGDTIRVTVSSNIILAVSASDTLLCQGENALLMVSNANNAIWSPSASLSDSSGNNVTATPSATTTYTVMDTSGSCSDTGYVTINVLTIDVNANPANTTICAGQTTTLSASGAATYTWFPNNAIDNATNPTVNVNPATSEIYTVVGTVGSCNDTSVATVIVTNIPTVNIAAADTQVCEGGSLTLTATSAINNYSWLPATYLDNPNNNAVTVSPPSGSSGTIIYTVTAGSGSCTADTSITITIKPSVSVLAAAYQSTLCQGDTVTLWASGTSNYSWTGTNINNSASQTVVASPSLTGANIYTVFGTDGTCSDSATVSITVVLPPTVSVSPADTSICQGGSVSLSAEGASTYTWLNNSDLSGTSGAIVTSTPSLSTSTYTVIGSSGSCTDSDYVTVNTETPLTITASSSLPQICKGESVSLSAGGGAANYSWSPASQVAIPSGSNTNATPTTTTTYTVTGYNTVCWDTASVTVLVTDPVTLTVSSDETTICAGSSATITASGATSYSWAPSAGLNNTITSTVITSPNSTVTYTVFGATNTCYDTATITIPVVSGISVYASASPSSVCKGSSSVLTASGASTYSWLSPGISAPTADSVTVTPSVTTTYTVVGSVTSCVDTTTVTVNINPLPAIDAGESQTIAIGSTAGLQASGAVSYNWSPSDNLSCTSCSNPEATPLQTTTYSVTGTDANGCTKVSTVVVSVDENYEIFVPSGFTPNNDGANDILFVRGRGVSELKLFVYNRWGEKVFETTSLDSGWDGTKNGQPLNSAVFVYYLKGKFYDGSEFKRKGDISLIR